MHKKYKKRDRERDTIKRIDRQFIPQNTKFLKLNAKSSCLSKSTQTANQCDINCIGCPRYKVEVSKDIIETT